MSIPCRLVPQYQVMLIDYSLPVEFATVGKNKDGKIYHHLWSAEEIDALLREQGLAKVDDEPEAGEIK